MRFIYAFVYALDLAAADSLLFSRGRQATPSSCHEASTLGLEAKQRE